MHRTRVLLLIAGIAMALVAALPASGAQMHTRVVGGHPASIDDMPWMVYLEADLGDGNAWSCGGTVVGTHFVLTAAHCVVDAGKTIKASQIGGVVGRADLRGSDGVEFSVRRIAVNPTYARSRTAEGGPGDAALLWTSSELPDAYRPLRLATTSDAPFYGAGQLARIAGWGLTSSAGGVTDVLRTAEVPIVSDAVCAADNQVSLADARAMVCAGFQAGGVDTCQGDSGGPLTVLNGYSEPLLAGIVSWGYDCAAPGRPGLYTRVATLTSWIDPLLQGNTDAWAAAADQSPPRMLMWPARMDGQARVRFAYRILGEHGRTRETITIRRSRTGTVLRRIPMKGAVKHAGAISHVMWRVPNALPYGAYVWCLTSSDAHGNTSARHCAPLTV